MEMNIIDAKPNSFVWKLTIVYPVSVSGSMEELCRFMNRLFTEVRK